MKNSFFNTAELHPQNAKECLFLAEQRLENEIKHFYTYHFCATSIAEYYRKHSDLPALKRMVNKIHENISNIEHKGERKNLQNLLHDFPEVDGKRNSDEDKNPYPIMD